MSIAEWGWPQWIIITLWTIGLISHAINHGKPIYAKYNIIAKAVAIGFFILILFAGGFFS